MTGVLKVKCPICGKMVARTDAEFPFCSDRCRSADLGNWATEKYVIPSPLEPHEIRRYDPSGQHDED
jgi:endogenous inhibitor of DNA gyrase (YacG/DUF329 family)